MTLPDLSKASPDLLLGLFLGGDSVLMVLSVLVANAYRERLLLVLAAGVAGVIATTVLQASPWHEGVPQSLMAVMALACLHLRALTSHVGSLRPHQRWMTGGALAIALVGLADVVSPWRLLPAGTALWILVATLVTLRAWPQSRPWIVWTVPGHVALAAAAVHYGLSAHPGGADPTLAAILGFWAMALYLASVWRSRVFGEDQSRRATAETFNPLTGLATAEILGRRVQSARALMRRYGHPGSILLVHVEHLASVAQRLGAETAEGVALEAGTRIRDALGAGDVAARLRAERFAVLSEGTAPAEAAARLGSRILSNGLRAPLSVLPGNYLHFRIAITELPAEGVPLPELLEQLGERLDADVARARDKRIRVVPFGELKISTVPGVLPPGQAEPAASSS